MNFLVSLVFGFASGVFLRSLFSFGWEPVAFVLLLATILMVVPSLVEGKPRQVYSLGTLFCILLALGVARTSLTDTPLPKSFASDLRHRVTYEGVVVSDPDIRETAQRVQVRVQNEGDETTLLVVTKPYVKVAVGDTVRVSGTLLKPEPFDTDGGRVFRYDTYLQKDGIRFLLSFATLHVEEAAPWYSVPAALARIKHAFLHGLDATLPEQNAALAGGIVIGGKTGLSKELHQAFITSGLVHVIVLSGYNVMIVAEWMVALLAPLTPSRRVRAVAGAVALLLFVGIAGFSATAIRATLMALIALYARASGHTYAASRALFVAVLLMLMWNPLYLVFDPGFGLSVAATAGLIWLSPLYEGIILRARKRLGRGEPNEMQKFWAEAFTTTLAAQTGVLPLLLYNTGNFSLVALPANLLVVAVMPLAMAFAAVAGISGWIFGSVLPLLATVLALPAKLITSYILFVATKSAALPGAALIIPAFSFMWVILVYATIIFIASSKRFSTTAQLTFDKKAST